MTEHIFLIGMPRSGTTVLFEAMARRHDVAWFSNYLRRFPGRPEVAALSRLVELFPGLRRSEGRSDQTKAWLKRLGISPDEAYPVWKRCCGEHFLYDYLLGDQATAAEKKRLRATIKAVLHFQNRPHFIAKLTGPGRIGYLSSIYPDARFVHVIRDGRAVVQSLMRKDFWFQSTRMNTPAWQNGLTDQDLADWTSRDSSPLALAAVQWRRVIASTREEAARLAPDRYAEAHYENFVIEPHRVLDGIADFCNLPHSSSAEEPLQWSMQLTNMNWQWQERFNGREIAMLNDLMQDTLETLGYQVDPPAPPSGNPPVATPFSTANTVP